MIARTARADRSAEYRKIALGSMVVAAALLLTASDARASDSRAKLSISAVVQPVSCMRQSGIAGCLMPNRKIEQTNARPSETAPRESAATSRLLPKIELKYLVLEF